MVHKGFGACGKKTWLEVITGRSLNVLLTYYNREKNRRCMTPVVRASFLNDKNIACMPISPYLVVLPVRKTDSVALARL